METTRTRATIDHLRLCQEARRRGVSVSYTTDPWWLVNQAINRRAGWLEQHHCGATRGTTQPTERGAYPRKADGDYLRTLRQLADRLNTPRLIVRAHEVACYPEVARRLSHRFDA